MTGSVSRQCVVLAGGLGTRLGTLVRERPKPLLTVGDRPFLAHTVGNARRFGFDDFLLLAGYRAEAVETWAAASETELGANLRVVAEPSPAGTAGALLQARDLLADEFLMMNGDSFFDVNLLDLRLARGNGEVLGAIALRRVPDASRFGVVSVDRGRIAHFRERPERPGASLVNGGIYWLSKAVVERVGALPCSLERDVFPALAAEGRLAGREYEGFFTDIGTPQDLEGAQSALPAALRRPAVFFDRDGVLNHDIGHLHAIEDFRWVEGAREAIKLANDRGYLAFVVTNQSGVARGFYDEAAVQRLHAWMNEELRPLGAHIDDFRYCPHHRDGSVAPYAHQCACRKPLPGMIDALLSDWPVDPARSLLIGDQESDLAAAEGAGIAGHLFAGGSLERYLTGLLRLS